MAGTVAYGDLKQCLESRESFLIRHRLASVKILLLPPDATQPDLWRYITFQGISRAEIQAPDRQHILCMAVTASDTRDRGRPTSWSGALDQLADSVESDDIDRARRLIIVCAGNIADIAEAVDYPATQLSDSIHDPAHAWNALTVGAYTTLNWVSDRTYEGYEPVAVKNSLSPFSTTSVGWENNWPLRLEIVMEGGNLAHNEIVSLPNVRASPWSLPFANQRKAIFAPST